eukprot:Nk52_evm9s24 gene=Nk52_evmTU9s24
MGLRTRTSSNNMHRVPILLYLVLFWTCSLSTPLLDHKILSGKHPSLLSTLWTRVLGSTAALYLCRWILRLFRHLPGGADHSETGGGGGAGSGGGGGGGIMIYLPLFVLGVFRAVEVYLSVAIPVTPDRQNGFYQRAFATVLLPGTVLLSGVGIMIISSRGGGGGGGDQSTAGGGGIGMGGWGGTRPVHRHGWALGACFVVVIGALMGVGGEDLSAPVTGLRNGALVAGLMACLFVTGEVSAKRWCNPPRIKIASVHSGLREVMQLCFYQNCIVLVLLLPALLSESGFLGHVVSVFSPGRIILHLFVPSVLVMGLYIGMLGTVLYTCAVSHCLSWLFIDVFVFIIEVFVFKGDMLIQRIFGMITIAVGCVIYLIGTTVIDPTTVPASSQVCVKNSSDLSSVERAERLPLAALNLE